MRGTRHESLTVWRSGHKRGIAMRAVLSRAGLTRLAAAGAAVFAGAATSLLGPAPAHADTVFIEVNPSTILAGYAVSLRASCGSTVNPATAKSEAFGTVT